MVENSKYGTERASGRTASPGYSTACANPQGSRNFRHLLPTTSSMLDHEKLDVYQCAIQFVALAFQIIEQLPRGHSSLADQFRRAAISIPLNIAEGAGKPTGPERARYHSIARGSAMECGAVLDVIGLLGKGMAAEVGRGKELLVRTVAMLSKMCR
jgi:four helix bundle protein